MINRFVRKCAMPNANLKVFIVETDLYARNAISSYLAWDRRTRVTQKFATIQQLAEELTKTHQAEMPDTILLDDFLLPTPEAAAQVLATIQALCKAHVLILAHQPIAALASAAREAGAKGYVSREEVGLQISWMVVWARDYPFVVTPACASFFSDAAVLPDGRKYPELTDRIRQALILCVVEGMSAE